MRQIVFSAEARSEFEEAASWYDQQAPGLGDDFEQEVDAVLKKISENPERFRSVGKMLRKAVVHRFPYSLHFRIDDDIIGVVAVFHGARNPAEITRRKR